MAADLRETEHADRHVSSARALNHSAIDSEAPSSDPHGRELESFVAERVREGSTQLYAETLAWMERSLIVQIVRLTKGNQSRAAEMLGITRGCLRRKIRSHGVHIGRVITIDGDPMSDQHDGDGWDDHDHHEQDRTAASSS